jgi:molybdate transport system ATP-binding protein
VRELLELLHVAGLAARRPAQLSVGQQQRVALARALAPEPKLLILDEPFSALDETLRRELRRELRALRDRTGIPMVLVSHDLADVLALADRVIVIEHGRVVSEGSPMDVLAPRQAGGPLSRLLEVENVFEGTVIEASQETGVMRLEVSGVRIVVPYGALTPGVRARVGLRAGDILVATARPHGLSAQNALAGTVRAVERRGYESEVSVDCGPLFRAEVTPRAVETLGLALGKQVWLVFKSNSCFLIE